jgi:hypothetical protein
LRISIDGWTELRDEVGDDRALEILRQMAARLPQIVERDMRSGGRIYTEFDLDTGAETVQITPVDE